MNPSLISFILDAIAEGETIESIANSTDLAVAEIEKVVASNQKKISTNVNLPQV